jgi:hypothetical protein
MDSNVTDERLSDVEKVQKDLLWESYAELRTQARHVETLRTNAVSTVLVLTSALIAVITVDGKPIHDYWELCLSIAILGVLTTVFSILFLLRYEVCVQKAGKCLDELDRLFVTHRGYSINLRTIHKEVHEHHLEWREGFRTRVLFRFAFHRTHAFWVLVPVVITAAGIFLSLKSRAA